MAAISNNDIARSIYSFLQDKGGTEAENSKKIVQFLFRKRLLSKSNDILSKLENIFNAEMGIVKVKVSCAGKLRDSARKDLMNFLKRRYGAKEFILEEHFDESLLGGLRVEVGDEVADLTLKNKIGKLQEYLTESL